MSYHQDNPSRLGSIIDRNTLERDYSQWDTEFEDSSSFSGEVWISLRSKTSTPMPSMPKELFLTHTYKISVHYEGPLAHADNLFAECTLLSQSTKAEITKDGKPAIEGTTSTALTSGDGILKLRFIDTSYHHQKADFVLRMALLLPDASGQFKIVHSKISTPFKVYSKKRTNAPMPFPAIIATNALQQQASNSGSGSLPNLAPAPVTSHPDTELLSLLPKYIAGAASLTPEHRHALRVLFVQSTPISELKHFEELSRSMLDSMSASANLVMGSISMAPKLSPAASTTTTTTPSSSVVPTNKKFAVESKNGSGKPISAPFPTIMPNSVAPNSLPFPNISASAAAAPPPLTSVNPSSFNPMMMSAHQSKPPIFVPTSAAGIMMSQMGNVVSNESIKKVIGQKRPMVGYSDEQMNQQHQQMPGLPAWLLSATGGIGGANQQHQQQQQQSNFNSMPFPNIMGGVNIGPSSVLTPVPTKGIPLDPSRLLFPLSSDKRPIQSPPMVGSDARPSSFRRLGSKDSPDLQLAPISATSSNACDDVISSSQPFELILAASEKKQQEQQQRWGFSTEQFGSSTLVYDTPT